MAALAESTGEKGDVFLDVDIDKAREKYERAKEFVEKRGLAYNLSSGRLEDLGGSELARLPELVESDYEFGGKGGIRTKAAKERIVIRLFPKVAPLATKNFRLLVTGEKGKSGKTGVMLSYKTIPFHRVIKGFVAQAGDITMRNGTGGEAVIGNGKPFKDDREGLKKKLDKRGLVAMGNKGKNSNTSQFFFVLGAAACKKLSGKHVVFGEIVSGFDVLDAIEAAGAESDAANGGKPSVDVAIADCGVF